MALKPFQLTLKKKYKSGVRKEYKKAVTKKRRAVPADQYPTVKYYGWA